MELDSLQLPTQPPSKQLSPRAQKELLSQEEFCFGSDYKLVLEPGEWEEGRVKGMERGLMAKKFECPG